VLGAVSAAVAVVGFCVLWFGITPELAPQRMHISWFSLDNDQYLALIDDRHNEAHETSGRHPLISALTVVPVQALEAAGIGRPTALRLYVSLIGALWLVAGWLVFLLARGRVLAGLALTAVLLASAPYLVYAATFESFALAGLTIAAGLALAQLGFTQRGKRKERAYVLAGVVPMAVTTTMGVVGFFAAWADVGLRYAAGVLLRTYVVLSLAFAVQSTLFSESRFFLSLGGHAGYVNLFAPGQWASNVYHWLTTLLVMPGAQATTRNGTTNIEPVFDFGARAILVVLSLLAIAGSAVVLARRREPKDLVALAVFGFLAAQVAVFGREPFLQTPLAVVPALYLVALAWPRSPRASVVASIAAFAFAGLLAVANLPQLGSALDLL
jgi:hypothetical protein